jgi:nitroreductase
MAAFHEESNLTQELIHTLLARRSIRKYTNEAVDDEKVRVLLEAAMAAPSASNRKPWHFIVVKERKKLDELASGHPHGKMLFEAPLCVAVCGDTTVSERFWVQDCSAATENLLIAAVTLGLGAVWLGVYPSEERVNDVRKTLNTPDNVTPLNLISIGHPAEKKDSRTQYDETRVHREQW